MDQKSGIVIPAPFADWQKALVGAALIVCAVVIGLLFVWQIREALLLAFAASLFATILVGACEPLRRSTGLPHNWSVMAAGLLLLALVSGMFWLMGAQIVSQVRDLAHRLPRAIPAVEQRFGISIADLTGGASQDAVSNLASTLFHQLGAVFSVSATVFAALTSLVLVIVGGFFFALSPDLYRDGLLHLLPRTQRDRIGHALDTCGRALRLWLLGQLVAMVLIGSLSGIGTWALGLPSPLALGLFAGLTEFIPMIGPILGAIPAGLLAATVSGEMVLWTALLFTGIQQVESNFIMPVVQKRLVEIPGGLMLFAVLAVGLVFGVLGVLVAAPLTVVAYVLVKLLYVEATLGEHTSVPGER